MKKSLLTFLLMLTTVATPLWAATKTVTVGSIIYNIDEENLTASVGWNTHKFGTSKRTVNIPSTFTYDGKTYTVTKITNSFQGDTTVTSISVPPTVTHILAGAFVNCKKLTQLTLSEGLIEIEGNILGNAPIKRLTLPKSLKLIGGQLPLSASTTYLCIKSPDLVVADYIHTSASNMTIINYSQTPDITISALNTIKELYVPRGCTDVYKGWGQAKSIIEFGAEQAELRIAQGDYGSVVMNVDKDVQHTIKLECGEGWKIARVMFNEIDMTDNLDADNSFTTPEITDDSNLLSVTYEESLAGVETVTDDANVSVTARRGLITVSGATAGTRISVYDLSGALQSPAITATGSGSEMIETVPGAVRIVRVGSRTFKVMP